MYFKIIYRGEYEEKICDVLREFNIPFTVVKLGEISCTSKYEIQNTTNVEIRNLVCFLRTKNINCRIVF